MSISIFDLFSVGIGPSSSHTVGPMRAAKNFLETLTVDLSDVKHVCIVLYGSLAYTGKGHGTDKALVMGLCGHAPESIDPDSIADQIKTIRQSHSLLLLDQHRITFDYEQDLQHNYQETLQYHSNGMRFIATTNDNTHIEKTYFSIGGGFIITEDETNIEVAAAPVAYPFNSAAELLELCHKHQLSIHELMLENEKTWRTPEAIRNDLLNIADVMVNCIDKGCHTSGNLAGRLNVRRRAPALYQRLMQQGKPSITHPQPMNWLNVFALAVNEENAAGGRVVTAPTNGAAGIIPSVLRYFQLVHSDDPEHTIQFLLTAGAIGMLYKKNASISGAEMGCQGEVGVACSMAAAAFASVRGANIEQIENAAEIGMEHNLGLTCDPVDGLVQIPCIERNAMGAVKAVNAAQLALAEDGKHNVSLDAVIKTMFEIGKNMNSIYKETSLGGLAVNVIEC